MILSEELTIVHFAMKMNILGPKGKGYNTKAIIPQIERVSGE